MRQYVSNEAGGLDMRDNRLFSEAGQQYKSAYDAHYKTKDIQKAFALYGDIIATHPDTQEAGYSRSQILNIVKEVVPKKTAMDSLMDLARIHFE
jgi:hypothetical protein